MRLEEGWRIKAPKTLVKQLDAALDGQAPG
jgi:hypothetical protein